jgi:hypothetical protein
MTTVSMEMEPLGAGSIDITKSAVIMIDMQVRITTD